MVLKYNLTHYEPTKSEVNGKQVHKKQLVHQLIAGIDISSPASSRTIPKNNALIHQLKLIKFYVVKKLWSSLQVSRVGF